MTDSNKPVRSITSWGDLLTKSDRSGRSLGRPLTVRELEDIGITELLQDIEYLSQLPEAHAAEMRRVSEGLIAERLGLMRSDREPAKLLARAQTTQNPIHARALRMLALAEMLPRAKS